MTIMRRSISVICTWIVLLFLIVSSTSCATIFCGTRPNIYIEGDVDEPVTIVSSYGEWKDVELPTTVKVRRHQLEGQRIQISSAHHTFDDIVLQKTFNEVSLFSLAVDLPFVVDLLTNAVSKPKYNNFHIIPKDSLENGDSVRMTVPTTTITASRKKQTELLPMKYPRHEITVSLGLGRNQADHLRDSFSKPFINRYHLEEDNWIHDFFGKSYKTTKVDYHYRFNRKWEMGAMVAWGWSSENYKYTIYETPINELSSSDKNQPKVLGQNCGYQKSNTFSFAPSVRYTWYEVPKFRVYSRVALGMMRHHIRFDTEQWEGTENVPLTTLINNSSNTQTRWRMAYQISPLGISFGKPSRWINLEVGYGFLGVVNFGYSFCF